MIAMPLRKIKDHWVAILVFAIANIVMFWPMYFRGQIPFPADLLVSFFFPWKDGGFFGYNPWTTHKEYLAADAIRQMFVWKSLGFNLWNPYNFAGSFLFANLQSSFLFPGAWIPSVVLIMTLFGFFTYLFLRSLKLSTAAAVLGGLAAGNISYLTGWQEILVNCQSALFLPLILLAINHKKYFLVSIFLAFSIFGGHVQTTAYVYIITILYLLYKRVPILVFSFYILYSLLLAAVQLVPTIEAYFYSARETSANVGLIARTVFPLQGLITYFVSDFFGNTASFNLNPTIFNYADARSYIGLVAAVFSLFAIYKIKDNAVKFFFFLAGFGLLFASWPLGLIFNYLHIPILSSVVPARMIMVSLFACAVLAGYGFEYVMNNKIKIKPLTFVFLIFTSLWIYALIGKDIVARNNLIIPTITFFALVVCLLLKKKIFIILIFILTIVEPGYYFVKHQPFAEAKYMFPNHPVFTFLKENAGYDRFMGFGSAYLDNNFATYFKVYSPEGYDPLYIKRYGELISAGKKDVPRSDAKLPEKDDAKRDRLMDLTGVKYVMEKIDEPKDESTPDTIKFPEDKYKLVWQVQKWQAYKRLTALPRTFLASDYVVINDDEDIIRKLHDKSFDLRKTLILEEDPSSRPQMGSTGSAQIVSYEPSKVTIKTNSLNNSLLFLSDNYYVGWKAFVNGSETKIYRADYSFRTVPVPAGKNVVVFIYDPLSFKLGVIISVISLLGLLVCLKNFRRT